jgi:hypothetical protein
MLHASTYGLIARYEMAIGMHWGIKPWQMKRLSLAEFESRVAAVDAMNKESRG